MPAVLHTQGQQYPCEAANLSRSGALLIGSLPVPTVPQAQLTLNSPAGDLPMTLEGLLARHEPGASNQEGEAAGLAIRFCGIPRAGHAALEALISRVVEGATTVGILGRLPPNASKPEIVEALKRVPLPHRVALAGRAQIRERGWLIHDPSPQVINALTRNPQLVLHEVQGILALRTLSPTALETLARDSRWHDERVLALIVAHANTPLQIAEKIALGLSPNALARVVQASNLNEGLRQKLLRQIARRKIKA